MKKKLVIDNGEETTVLRSLILPESQQINTRTVYIPTTLGDRVSAWIWGAKSVAHNQLRTLADQIGADFVVAEVCPGLTNERSYCVRGSFYSNKPSR
ncbi:MAG: hypothetical protein WC238_06220 [Parcubacteria group bacterium]|jgi:hypothetical protein